MDPFLLMDHFGPMVLPPGTDAGFPPHPHRGFQTLTYLLQGAFRHRDSTGGSGLLRPGGAQLMNAGAGIVHEEMPVPEHLETGGPIEGVQLWINLPRAHKGSAPGYTDLQPESHALAGPSRGAYPRTGRAPGPGVTGPAAHPPRSPTPTWNWRPAPGSSRPCPAGWTAAVVPLHGSVRIPGTGRPGRHGGPAGRGRDAGVWRPPPRPVSCCWPANPSANPSPTTALS